MSSETVTTILRFAEYGCSASEIAEYLGMPERDVRQVTAQWWGRRP